MARANYGAIETDPRAYGRNTAPQNDFKQVSMAYLDNFHYNH